jgi:hypothetical protein
VDNFVRQKTFRLTKRVIIFLFAFSQTISAQTNKHKYYFTATGDTVLFPIFCTGDSTHFNIATIKNQKRTILKSFAVKGYDNYSIPENILKTYKLNFKGIQFDNDSTKAHVFVKEKIIKNNKIGFSLDAPMKLFRLKVRIDIFYKGKKVLTNFTTEPDYDANQKKDFKTEKFFRYNIVWAENNTKYFVTISPYKHHPSGFDIPWEILDDFATLIDVK